MMLMKYLTAAELARIIKYEPRTIHEKLKDRVLLEGIHYIRPFGGRKILYIWEAIQRDLALPKPEREVIPMANGGVAYGAH